MGVRAEQAGCRGWSGGSAWWADCRGRCGGLDRAGRLQGTVWGFGMVGRLQRMLLGSGQGEQAARDSVGVRAGRAGCRGQCEGSGRARRRPAVDGQEKRPAGVEGQKGPASQAAGHGAQPGAGVRCRVSQGGLQCVAREGSHGSQLWPQGDRQSPGPSPHSPRRERSGGRRRRSLQAGGAVRLRWPCASRLSGD